MPLIGVLHGDRLPAMAADFRPAAFDGHVAAFCEARLAQPSVKSSHPVRPLRRRHGHENDSNRVRNRLGPGPCRFCNPAWAVRKRTPQA
jgi:hypothetical protein